MMERGRERGRGRERVRGREREKEGETGEGAGGELEKNGTVAMGRKEGIVFFNLRFY